MLRINFLNKKATDNQTKEFAKAVKYELCEMSIKMNMDIIAKQAIIETNEKGKYTEEDVKIARLKIDALEEKNIELTRIMTELEESYNLVISTMVAANEKGFSNKMDTVRTALRVVACAENSKLYRYAIIPAFQNEELYNALEKIHVTNTVSEGGYSTNNKERITLYKAAQEQLDDIMRETFSLPVETLYTAALRVKLNASDRKVLHDVYVKGFSNKMKKGENGDIIFLSRKYNTAIKQTRKGIDYSGIATDIAKLVLSKYAE